jgi:hypothetical protein
MSEFDERARLAASRLRASVGPVIPRPQTAMTTNRTRLLAAGVAVVLLAAGVAALLVRSSPSSTTAFTPPASTPAPAGVTAQTFAPAGLGATLMVPSTWANSPPASGFQYVIRGLSSPAGFVGAGRQGGVVPITAAQLGSTRRSFLTSMGATIDSVSRGTVEGHPAVRLRYRISGGGLTVDDTEYDIVATGTLAAGASQHQTTYDVITIVIGTPVSLPNRPLVDWIASTITVHK